MCEPLSELLREDEARMSMLLYAIAAVVLVGALTAHYRHTSQSWRKRRDPFLRHGWGWCPTCLGNGAYHHDLVLPGVRTPPDDPCPTCRGIGQVSFDARVHVNAPYRSADDRS
jgi:hypothetical protein